MIPTVETLDDLFRLKYGAPALGWGPRQRRRFGYFTPDDYYEAIVEKLVTTGCAWLDVGCGRDIFPDNRKLAHALAARSGHLVGVDSSENIYDNPHLHKAVRTSIESFRTDSTFDLVTLRMVVEHVRKPDAVIVALQRITRPGSKVVVYTVNKRSPVSVLSAVIPFQLHHALKSLLWRTEERDTFPVVYAMNTRKDLAREFMHYGFREAHFMYLDDCRLFARFRRLNYCELLLRQAFCSIRVRYPETCLLAIYERT